MASGRRRRRGTPETPPPTRTRESHVERRSTIHLSRSKTRPPAQKPTRRAAPRRPTKKQQRSDRHQKNEAGRGRARAAPRATRGELLDKARPPPQTPNTRRVYPCDSSRCQARGRGALPPHRGRGARPFVQHSGRASSPLLWRGRPFLVPKAAGARPQKLVTGRRRLHLSS